MKLIDILETEGKEEKLTVFILYEWSNLIPDKWHNLLLKTFGSDGVMWRRQYKKQKDVLCFYFQDGTMSYLRCGDKFEWTWNEIIELIKQTRQPIEKDDIFNSF